MNNIRKTIIAPSTNHEHIIKNTVKKNSAIAGTSILPFSVYKNQFTKDHQDKISKFAIAYQTVQNIKEQCSIISNSLVYPQIVQQLINFTIDCVHYGINCDDLPKTTQKEKDIAVVVGVLWPIYKSTPNLSLIKQEVKDASNLEIYPFSHSLDEKMILDYLQSVGASTVQPRLVEHPKTLAFYALNHAKEAEAIAQHVLKDTSLSTLIVCCETSVLPTLLTSAFERYNLIASTDITSSAPMLIDQFLSMVGFIKESSIEYLIQCIHNNVFPLNNSISFLKYITLVELSYEELFIPFEYYTNQQEWVILDERDQRKLISLESDAEKDRQNIVAIIQPMLSNPLQSSFEYFATKFPTMNYENQQTLLALKEMIEKLSVIGLDTTSFDAVFLHLAASISAPTIKYKSIIHITSLAQSYQPGFDQVIIVGANQQHYPGFSKLNGIIDEQYLLTIQYPSLESRLNHHMDQLHHVTRLAPTVIVSYATSTFDGKAMAEAYEIIDQITSTPKAWDIQSYGTNQPKSYQLLPEISQSLFLNNNRLYGSVSSFEIFFHCQYRYFLKSGLKLSEIDPEPALVALIGNISHGIVEQLIQSDAKGYAQLSRSELSVYVNHYFKDLHTLYPKQENYWNFVADRLTEQLLLAFNRLDAIEKDTSFTFNEAEKKFKVTWDLPNEIKLNLLGFVDRLDTTSDFFRIVDYKSSEKNLSFALVKSGLQLQLLTYLIVANTMYEQKASGAFYFSFLNKNVDVQQQKLSNGKLVVHTREDNLEAFYKAHKLSGWFVDDDGSMYDSDWFIKHINKKGKVKKSGLFDLEKIDSLLVTLYTHLSNQLQDGKIDRNPVQGACDYCDYKHMCIFKGSYRKTMDIDFENTLKQGEPE